MGLYYYESHLGNGVYTSEHHYSYEELYCDECGDSDTELGYFETPEDFVRYYVQNESYIDFYNEKEIEDIESITLDLCKEYGVKESNYETVCQEMINYFNEKLAEKAKAFKEIPNIQYGNDILKSIYNTTYKNDKLKQLMKKFDITNSLNRLYDLKVIYEYKGRYGLTELGCLYLSENK